MDIVYLGHSSFRLTGKSAKLVTDPFDPKMVGLKFPKVQATIATISHDHEDHNRADLVDGVKKVIAGPGEYEIEGVSVIGLSSHHDQEKGAKRGKNTIYVIEMDGVRLVHLGDLGHKLKEKDIDKIGDIDALMVPVGGVFTIGPQEAADVVHAIEPNVIIPMHYKQAGLNPKTFADLQTAEPFITALGVKVDNSPKFVLKADGFINGDQIIWQAPLFK